MKKVGARGQEDKGTRGQGDKGTKGKPTYHLPSTTYQNLATYHSQLAILLIVKPCGKIMSGLHSKLQLSGELGTGE